MKKVRCPICKEWCDWTDNPFRPFCSERCKDTDLGKWASEKYKVPVHEEEVGEGDISPKKNEEED